MMSQLSRGEEASPFAPEYAPGEAVEYAPGYAVGYTPGVTGTDTNVGDLLLNP